jgi:hypoxanthine phosphoribosyltransferase
MSLPITELNRVLQNATCLLSHDELMKAFDTLAEKINVVLKEENPILLTVMNGALMTSSELAKRLNFPLEMDYVHATRYRGEFAGGAIHWLHEPNSSLKDRTVLVVDDILDGGITLAEIVAYCNNHGAKKVYTAVMLDKYQKRVPNGLQKADFVGIEIEDHFVFGFGLDYQGYWRNTNAIYVAG